MFVLLVRGWQFSFPVGSREGRQFYLCPSRRVVPVDARGDEVLDKVTVLASG